jgi:dTDP-4-dehydrorhamnose 3,5-epimerase
MRISGGDEMLFEALDIAGAALVKIEPKADARGFFARTFCAREFAVHGLPAAFVQTSLSYNERRGTVRGLHFQWPPSREGKLVRCIRGALLDVLLDLRPDSPSYLRHCAIQLAEQSGDAVFIPHGIAHGFQTLTDQTEVLYQMTDFFAPHLSSGVRWNDPAFGIRWPIADIVISERDELCARFDRAQFEAERARYEQLGEAA